jgi:hypothetical protein
MPVKPAAISGGGALRDVGGMVDKDHRPQALIVMLRNDADETRVVAHRPPASRREHSATALAR